VTNVTCVTKLDSQSYSKTPPATVRRLNAAIVAGVDKSVSSEKSDDGLADVDQTTRLGTRAVTAVSNS